MTKDELARDLALIERLLDERIALVRIVINPDGSETGQRIYRGSFQRPRTSSEPPKSCATRSANGSL